MSFLTYALAAFVTILLALSSLAYRLWTILNPTRTRLTRSRTESTHMLIVLGSGGHTAEMIAMLKRSVTEKDSKLRLDWDTFTRRTWVTSTGDSLSASRAKDFEDAAGGQVGTYDIRVVPRAREIHQPLHTAPVSSLRCLVACIGLLTERDFPDIILCNGPATATIVILASVMLRFLNVGKCNSRGKMRTIYIESWARVKKLSLSGRLLSGVVDRFLVQWPQLAGKGRAEYAGVLV